MFSKISGPYSRPAPIKVKCVAKHTGQRGETYEVVDGVVAIKTSKMVATCALCDGKHFVVAHLKNDDCHRIDDNRSYYIKGYNVSEKYGTCKMFFNPSTVVFSTTEVTVSPDLERLCHHAVCPPSPAYQEGNKADYCTLSGVVASLSTTKLQSTKDGGVPLREIELSAGRDVFRVSLWRDVALEDISLSATIEISHVSVKRNNQAVTFSSTTYTTIKKSEIVPTAEEVEVVGICPTPTDIKILTSSMEEFSIPPHVWSGDTDRLILNLPLTMLIKHNEGVIISVDCPFFTED
ncbi:uncharacterized protein LOC143508708 [Brachyhypopomus gauderio]|uniref:uncharacterized protein LOC143500368 n=1 Tax=Brachyhypopomus gauderio TaxID=698409 RepID=UPI0040417D0B